MDYSRGYTAAFYASFINPKTWKSTEGFEITDGSISNQDDELKQSASITVRSYDYTSDMWVRIYMTASQNGGTETVPLFTGIATSPSENYTDGVFDITIQCYSVLKAVNDVMLPRGWYVLAGTNGVEKVQELLKVTPAPVEIETVDSYPILSDTIIAQDNETYLSMVYAILGAINWRIQIREDGTIYLSSTPEIGKNNYSGMFSSGANDVLETSFSISRDWFECPNVFQAIYGDYMAIARDDDPNSELSTVSRGREIWMSEDADLSEGESLGEYARKRLDEEQARSEKISYTRRYIPGIYQGDIVRINYPVLQGDYYVESQSITLWSPVNVSENAFRYY